MIHLFHNRFKNKHKWTLPIEPIRMIINSNKSMVYQIARNSPQFISPELMLGSILRKALYFPALWHLGCAL